MSSRSAHFRRLHHWIVNRGLRGFLKEFWYRLRLKLKKRTVPGQEKAKPNTAGPYPFDAMYGVETGGLVWGESLEQPKSKSAAYWATGYYGISPSAFTNALTHLELDWTKFSFVDVGCGKGRAMLLALRFPFRRVWGVELSPALTAVANDNLRRFAADWRQPQVPAEAFAGDAADFALPDGPVVMFLYHPFAAPLMKRFIAHVREAARQEPREIYMLYANPELGKLLEKTPGVEMLWRQLFSLTPEEGAADRFGSYGEYFAAYRITG
jgi:SAM-dependent methyltransferase